MSLTPRYLVEYLEQAGLPSFVSLYKTETSKKRTRLIFAGSSTREEEDVRGSIHDAYRHHLWRWHAQSLGYSAVEAFNQAEVARNW